MTETVQRGLQPGLAAAPGSLLTAHQPDLLPWSGYFWKMAQADVMDIAIHDQFQSRGYQRRVLMRDSWASLPVQRPTTGAPISDVLIAAGGVQVLRDVVVGRYRDARWWPSRGPVVLAWLDLAEETSRGKLWLFNLTLIQLAALYLGIDTQLCVQEPLRQRGTAGIVELCALYGVDRYLSGQGGKAYLDETQMRQAGLEVLWSTHLPVSEESLLTVLFDYDDPGAIARLSTTQRP